MQPTETWLGLTSRNPLLLEPQNNHHLAFGMGIHQFAGMSLARLEVRIEIGRFLQRSSNFWLLDTPTQASRARFKGFLSAPFAVT